MQLKGKINLQNSLVLVKIAKGKEKSFVCICRQKKSRKAAGTLSEVNDVVGLDVVGYC